MPVIFWTDALIFLLLAVIAALAVYMRRREHLQRPWRKVTSNTTGMVSLVILIAYVVIGVLDTIHFYPKIQTQKGEEVRYQNEAISLFDSLVESLRIRDEKTYSAPFSAYLYSREILIDPDGKKRWGYPRLKVGGAHLDDPDDEKMADIMVIGSTGALKGILLWAVLVVAIRMPRWWRNRTATSGVMISGFLGNPGSQWRAIVYTLLIITVAAYTLADLSLFYHVLGTDKVGQDVFYQGMKSIRTGLVIGTLTTLIMLPFALALGILAGYFRGWIDDLIQYIYTTLNSIPGVLLIAASILMVQVYMANHEDEYASLSARADMRLLFLCLILGITSWTGLCRLLRAETLKLREMEYVQAAKALGVRQSVILVRHILPNVMHIVLISVVLDFSGLVLAEAVLSYINIGVDPTTISWGNMINSARLELAREPVVWWSLASAFLFMFTLVLAANLFADAVSEAFDPRRAK